MSSRRPFLIVFILGLLVAAAMWRPGLTAHDVAPGTSTTPTNSLALTTPDPILQPLALTAPSAAPDPTLRALALSMPPSTDLDPMPQLLAGLATPGPSVIPTSAPTPSVSPSPKPTPKPAPHRSVARAWRWDPETSFFGPGLYGRRTACGLALTKTLVGVASRTLPCGTLVQFRNPKNGRTVFAPVVDRGPYVTGRIWDLTGGACRILDQCYTGPIWWRLVRP